MSCSFLCSSRAARTLKGKRERKEIPTDGEQMNNTRRSSRRRLVQKAERRRTGGSCSTTRQVVQQTLGHDLWSQKRGEKERGAEENTMRDRRVVPDERRRACDCHAFPASRLASVPQSLIRHLASTCPSLPPVLYHRSVILLPTSH